MLHRAGWNKGQWESEWGKRRPGGALLTSGGPAYGGLAASARTWGLSGPVGPSSSPRFARLGQVVAGKAFMLVFVSEAFWVIFLEVLELDAVELVEALGRVGLASGVGLGGPGEGVPGLVRTPGRQQRLGVGVEQARGPGPFPAAAEFGDLQGQDGGLGQPLVPADTRLDDAQLDLGGPVELGGM